MFTGYLGTCTSCNETFFLKKELQLLWELRENALGEKAGKYQMNKVKSSSDG